VDVDALSDGTRVVIGGVMQHIEDAGIHSGDSACVLPPYLIGEQDLQTMRDQTVAMAKAFNVVGLINVQFAIRHGVVYVLEVNPRASRTIPFVSKAIGVPLASHAARVMCGETLEQIGFTEEIIPPFVSVKEAVFPFNKFAGTDPILGPEMRSTGEVMGISDSFGSAFAKAQLAASNGLPLSGTILVTVNDTDKPTMTPIARRFHEMGFRLVATGGTYKYLRARGIPVTPVLKVHEGRPNCMDMIVNGEAQLLINTPFGKHSLRDDYTLRQAAIRHRVAYTTTLSAASAACDAILSLRSRTPTVRSLQEWQADIHGEITVTA
jgi:carbamoyl-phosphate synthase large subunit